jgi:tetratricopeptide (TPR) repeat protein
VNAHTNHEALARAEYARARANFQAGHDTNALAQFTNFIARFPTNELALRAQLWVGDYYYRLPDFQKAEENYQWCYQNTNWLVSKLTYEARMMAGRSAFARSSWNDAKDYFGRVAENTNCPIELRAQAFFAFGDTLVSQSSTNKLSDYKEALNAYDQVGYLCPTNPIAVLALGAKAHCFLQSQDYAGATNAFLQVVNSPVADAVARADAKVGLGLTFEKLAQQPTSTNRVALLTLARDQYLDVFEGPSFLRDGETADGFWTMKAGTEAVRICEAMKQPGQARRLCEALLEKFPVLRLEDKIKALKAQEQRARGQN